MALTPTAPHDGPRRFRRSYGGVALLGSALLLLGLAACGGGAPSQSAPIPSESPMSTTASATASSSAPATPQSPFEHDAQVKVLRQWAAAAAKDINADDKSFPRSSRFETPAGRVEFAGPVFGGELGRYYPGPLPFTPVAVKTSGGTSEVFACIVGGGFSRDSRTSTKVEHHQVNASKITLVKAQGGWRIDSLYAAPDTDCSGVKIERATW